MPRLDANGALELGASLIACARAEARLPSALVHGLDELIAEHRNLEAILDERLGPPPPDGYRARRADVRSITDMASQFIEAFRKSPQLEISGVHMPFDTAAEDALKGDIGSDRAIAEDVRFAVTIGRRLGK